jgi:hypothetical protein
VVLRPGDVSNGVVVHDRCRCVVVGICHHRGSVVLLVVVRRGEEAGAGGGEAQGQDDLPHSKIHMMFSCSYFICHLTNI